MSTPDIDTLFAKNKSFCALPWVQVSSTIDGVIGRCCVDVSTHNGQYYHSAIRPKMKLSEHALGCLTSSPYAQDNPDKVASMRTAFNSAAMRETRQAMLKGAPVSSCTQCYWAEARGFKSMRQYANAGYRWSVDWAAVVGNTLDGMVDSQPISLDLRLGNHCNLRCTMCCYPTSHSLKASVQTWQKGVLDPYSDSEDFWNDMRSLAKTTKYIYFAGGEPFLQRAHMDLLKLLRDEEAAPAIELGYNSNLTVLPKELFGLWAHFKGVRVGASCDGVGAVFERIRLGSKWPVFAENLQLVRQHAQVYLSVTIQKDNLLHLDELLQWAEEHDLEVSLGNILQEPASLRIDRLGRDEIFSACEMLLARASGLVQRGNAKLADEVVSFCGALRVWILDRPATG